jgi:hypothetical protein
MTEGRWGRVGSGLIGGKVERKAKKISRHSPLKNCFIPSSSFSDYAGTRRSEMYYESALMGRCYSGWGECCLFWY